MVELFIFSDMSRPVLPVFRVGDRVKFKMGANAQQQLTVATVMPTTRVSAVQFMSYLMQIYR